MPEALLEHCATEFRSIRLCRSGILALLGSLLGFNLWTHPLRRDLVGRAFCPIQLFVAGIITP